MKLLALTFGDENCASTQYRILQYRPLMEAAGITLEHAPAKSFTDWQSLPDYDTVILQKTLLSRRKIRLISKGAKRFLYDSDDRIWLRPGKPYGPITALRIKLRLQQICREADLCMTANGIIANDLMKCGGKTKTIPMSLDGSTWKAREKPSQPLTVGWTGSPASLVYLEDIRPALVKTQKIFPNVRWHIHCGKKPDWRDLSFEHIPYVPGNESKTVSGFHIGLLPLPDGPFARGKSPIKALQYFSSKVALLYSPIGATEELTNNNKLGASCNSLTEWSENLSTLLRDDEKRNNMVKIALETFREKHEIKQTFQTFVSCLRG